MILTYDFQAIFLSPTLYFKNYLSERALYYSGWRKENPRHHCNYRRDNMGFIFSLRRHLTGLRARRPKEQGGSLLGRWAVKSYHLLVAVINAEYFQLLKYNHVNPRFLHLQYFLCFFHRKTAGRYPPAHNEILERDAIGIIRVL